MLINLIYSHWVVFIMTPNKEVRTAPKPKYSKCNKGHELVLMYSERHNANIWDCPICIEEMRKAEQGIKDCYGKYPDSLMLKCKTCGRENGCYSKTNGDY